MKNENAADYTAAAASLAVRFAPSSVLCIGPADDALFGRPAMLVRLAPDAGLGGRLARLGRFHLAFVSGLECMSRTDAVAVLARLRDVHAPRVIALLARRPAPEAASFLADTDLLALGFMLYEGDGDARVAFYDVAEYKHTPDWLNPRVWTHPERGDKAD